MNDEFDLILTCGIWDVDLLVCSTSPLRAWFMTFRISSLWRASSGDLLASRQMWRFSHN